MKISKYKKYGNRNTNFDDTFTFCVLTALFIWSDEHHNTTTTDSLFAIGICDILQIQSLKHTPEKLQMPAVAAYICLLKNTLFKT